MTPSGFSRFAWTKLDANPRELTAEDCVSGRFG